MQCGIDGQLSPCVHYINITALNTKTTSVLLLSETVIIKSSERNRNSWPLGIVESLIEERDRAVHGARLQAG